MMARAMLDRSDFVWIWIVMAAAACGGRAASRVSAQRPTAVASVSIGACGDPARDGILSSSPRLLHADRDLGGGPAAEQVIADKKMCDDVGNCQWNVFLAPPAGETCFRYLGTLAASTLEPLETSGQQGMLDVRGYWALPSGRVLVQQYRFARGGYRVVDALLCRRSDDDRLECSEDQAHD